MPIGRRQTTRRNRSRYHWKRLQAELLEERRLLAFNVLNAQLQVFEGADIVPFGSEWRYLDDGSDLDTAWRAADFDDAAWLQGPAQLGYGDGDEATEISFGDDPDNKYVTTYFRRAFDVTDADAIDVLKLSVLRDDGIAVYLNGQEVLRDNLAADAAASDFALTTISGADEAIRPMEQLDFGSLPAGTLVSGQNVLAAEVHQANATSSDLSFDLGLSQETSLGLRIDFDMPVDGDTLEAADLLVDGNPIALSVSTIDAQTVQFRLPALAPGVHTFEILAGAILSDAGEPLEPYSDSATVAAANQFAIKHPPRLQPGNAPLAGFAGSELDQVDILWQTIPADGGTEDSFSVEYRLANSGDPWLSASAVQQEDTQDGGRIEHASSILGLAWNTDYEYRVVHRRADVIVKVFQHTFRTRLQAGDPTPFRFVAYGDSANGSALGFREVQSRINTVDPSFAVLLGDNIYFTGSFDESDSRFDPSINPELTDWAAEHVNYLGLGNHDIGTEGGRPSEIMFSVPIPVAGVNAPAQPPANERDEHSFSWDYGDVHFVTFDTNSLDDGNRLDGLLDYVVADLQASNARWKIVYGHHPVAGAPDKVQKPGDYYYQQVVSRLLGAGADLFLAGHSHMYHWTYPLTGQVNGEATFVPGPYNAFETNQGLPQLVSGVGGQSLRNGDYSPFPFVAKGFSQTTEVLSKNGFAQIDVTADQLTLSYVGADDGQVIDSFTLTAAVDLISPTARLARPLDGGPADLNGAAGSILVNTIQDTLLVDLLDVGDGIDDASVAPAALTLSRNGVLLENPADFLFGYDATFNRITIDSAGGGFGDGVYTLSLNGDGTITDLAGNPLAETNLTFEIDTSHPGATMAAFQQNVAGYIGTSDTFLAEDDPQADNSAAVSLEVDRVNVAGPTQTLLQFGAIFGESEGLIPADVAILAARLEIEVTNAGDGMELHRLLQPFADTDTWDSLDMGIQANDVEAAEAPAPTTGAVGVGSFSIDVRSSLIAWQAAPETNFGWALLPTGTNGIDFDSSEGVVPPRLVVSYTIPVISTLNVKSTAASASGASVQLSRSLDPSVLNLYGGQSAGDLPADVTLVGDQVGTVAGSLAWSAASNVLHFIKSGGPLLADAYTLRLFSRDGGVVDATGELLDGDVDNEAGGDFVTRFTIDASVAPLLSLPDVVRGPGQPVDIGESGGIPLTIDEASGLTELALTLRYDPDLLDVSGGMSLDLPLDWQLSVNTDTPGAAIVAGSGSALPAGPLRILAFVASVPAEAPVGVASPLAFSGISLNQGAIAARADEALFVSSYIGDASGDGTYSALDASLIARVAVHLDSGFDRFLAVDPHLVGDVTNNGGLSALDASFVARKAVGLEQSEIPDLPMPSPATSLAMSLAPDVASKSPIASLAAWDFVRSAIDSSIVEGQPTGDFWRFPSSEERRAQMVDAAFDAETRWSPSQEQVRNTSAAAASGPLTSEARWRPLDGEANQLFGDDIGKEAVDQLMSMVANDGHEYD